MEHMATQIRNHISETVPKLKTFPNLGRVGEISDTKELVIPDMPFIIVYKVSENVVARNKSLQQNFYMIFSNKCKKVNKNAC